MGTLGLLIIDAPVGLLCLDGWVKPAKGYETPWIDQQGLKYALEMMDPRGTDFTPQLLKLQQAGVDEIYALVIAGQAVVLAKNMTKLGMDKSKCTLSMMLGASDVIVLGGQEAAENFSFQQTFVGPLHEPGIPEPEGMKLAKSLWDKSNPGVPMAQMYMLGVAGGILMTEALRLALEEVPAAQLTGTDVKMSGLNRITNWTTKGMYGPITYRDGVGNHSGPSVVSFWHFTKGVSYLVSDWLPIPTIRPEIE